MIAPVPAASRRTSPYKGLKHYTEQDSDYFFGRGEERDVIIANVKARRLTLLYGASGVGKSSVLRAGVLASLRGQARADARDEELRALEGRATIEYLPVVLSDWRDDPISGMARALSDAVAALDANLFLDLSEARGLEDMLNVTARAVNGYVLVILDQFEEYFLYRLDESGPGTYADEFVRAVNAPGLPAGFLLALREDALARLDRFKRDIPRLFEASIRIRHLTVAEARMAIEDPIAVYNEGLPEGERVTFDEDLPDEILAQVGAGRVMLEQAGKGRVNDGARPRASRDAIEAPYLQLVLERLWDEEVGKGSHRLRSDTFLNTLKGATNIVRTHLDRELAELPEQDRAAVADIFHHLVTPSGTKIAHAVPDLAEYSGRPEQEVRDLITRLTAGDARIVRPVPPPPDEDGPERVEIFHDVLAPAIIDWRARETANRAEREKEEERRQKVRFRRAFYFALLASVIAVVAFFVAIMTTVKANHDRAVAQSRQLAATANANLGSDPELSALLSLQALKIHKTREAEEALRAATPRLQVERTLTIGPPGSVYTQLNPRNRNQVVATPSDGKPRIVDVRTGKTLRTFRDPTYAARAAFSPDASAVVTADNDGYARVWDVATGRLVRRLYTPAQWTGTAVFSGDGRRVVGANEDGTATVWNATSRGRTAAATWGGRATRTTLRVVDTNDASHYVATAEFAPHDSNTVLTSDGNGQATMFNVKTRRRVRTMKGSNSALNDATFSADGKWVVTASSDGLVRVWSANDGGLVTGIAVEGGEALDARFSRDAGELVVATANGRTEIWGVDRRLISVLASHSGPVRSAAFTPDGTRVVTGSDDGRVRFWRARPSELAVSLASRSKSSPILNAARFALHDNEIVTGADDGGVVLWDAKLHARGPYHLDRSGISQLAVNRSGDIAFQTGRGAVRVLPHTAKTGSGFRDPARSGVTGIGYDPSGKHLALTFSDGYVDVYTAPDYSNPSFSKKTGSQGATVAAFNRSGSELLTVNDDGKTWVWNLATKKRLARFTVLNNDFLPRNADLSPDGRTIAVGDYGGVLTLIDVRSGRRYELPAADSTLDNVAFSHDGRKIVTSGTKGVVRVWDLARRKSKLLRLTGTAALSYVEFSPDDRSVAAALEDGTIHMWDAQSGDSQVVFQPVTETGYATSLDFSSDGKFLLAAYLDGDARIWKTELARPLDVVERLARQRVSRSLTPAEKKTYLQGK